MVIKQARIRESLKRDTLLQHQLLMAKLVDFPDGEDTSHISVNQRDWMVEVERILVEQAADIKTLIEISAVAPAAPKRGKRK